MSHDANQSKEMAKQELAKFEALVSEERKLREKVSVTLCRAPSRSLSPSLSRAPRSSSRRRTAPRRPLAVPGPSSLLHPRRRVALFCPTPPNLCLRVLARVHALRRHPASAHAPLPASRAGAGGASHAGGQEARDQRRAGTPREGRTRRGAPHSARPSPACTIDARGSRCADLRCPVRRGARRCSNRLGAATRVAGRRGARSTPSRRPTSRRSRHLRPRPPP